MAGKQKAAERTLGVLWVPRELLATIKEIAAHQRRRMTDVAADMLAAPIEAASHRMLAEKNAAVNGRRKVAR